MKKLTVLTLLTSLSTFSMPQYLKGAKVTVTLKNGKTYTYNSEDMAVVPRKDLGKYKKLAQYKAKKLKKINKKIKNKELVKNKRNRAYILVGHGKTGNLKVDKSTDDYTIEHEVGTVGGIGYQYKFTEKVNVGIQVQSNGTNSLSIGTDF